MQAAEVVSPQAESQLALCLHAPCAVRSDSCFFLQLTTLSCEQLLQYLVTVQVLAPNHKAPDLHPLSST